MCTHPATAALWVRPTKRHARCSKWQFQGGSRPRRRCAPKLPTNARRSCAVSQKLMTQRLELLATLLSAEAGKPIRDARTEIERSALTFRVAAEEAERQGGDVLDLGINKASRGRLGLTRRFPAGLVAGITPFNLPVSLSAHKLAPAMAAGCPIILKVPSNAPLAMLEVAKIIEEAGAPAGAVSIMAMSIAVGDQLVTDARFKVLSSRAVPPWAGQ